MSDARLEHWCDAACVMGAEHARNVASWITNGNDTDESRRIKLQRIEDNGVYDVIQGPDLSGEWADNPTPRSLFESVTGLDAHAEATFNADAYNTVVDALADAYEQGVSETFEDACITELRRWLEEDETDV